MVGYLDDFSMSRNAAKAYDKGLVPASKIKGVPAELVRQFCQPVEWHHSSSWYNRVDFYDPEEVRATFGLEPSAGVNPDPEAVAALAKWRESRKVKPNIYRNCRVEWIDWIGTRRHPKAIERVAEGCTVAIKGQTATITLPDGTTFRKRLGANGFSFEPQNQIAGSR